MKIQYNILSLMVLSMLMAPVAVMALTAPHNETFGYRCSSCHSTHMTLGSTGFDNVCLNCHRPGDAKAGTMPFTQADASNPYGSVQNGYSGGIIPAKIFQTSHNWSGPDKNLAAGATPATGPGITALTIKGGTLLCVRCHAVHGPRSSEYNSAPFLRDLNDKNQMCLDCHKVRDTSSHMTGSHPININYTSSTSKVKLNPADYRSTPSNINPSNPTSDLNNYLVDGKILCTTCHGVHYTDSNSGTTHNAASFATLSASKGMLLRTNARGKTAGDPNICTNCHAAKLNHNYKDQNIQCNDCHSGHVEYDANATTADEKIPNKFLIRRYMNISTQFGKKENIRTFYRYTGVTTKEFFLGGDKTPGTQPVGICQACHNNTPAFKNEHYSSAIGTGLRDNHKDCDKCHSHKANTGSFSCANCHGFPPRANVKGGIGYAVWSTPTKNPTHWGYSSPKGRVDESMTPHATHADGKLYPFNCIECHRNNNHNNGNFRQVFRNADDSIIARSFAQYSSAASSGGDRYTCIKVYCHSDGKPIKYVDVIKWKNTKNTISDKPSPTRCVACHGDKRGASSTGSALSGAHQKHTATTAVNYACQNCHAGTLAATFNNNSALVYPARKHVNGVKDVIYNFPSNAALHSKVKDAAYAGDQTCSTIYCHSNGAGKQGNRVPTWSDSTSGQCGACHKVLATTSIFGVISSNGHFEHLSSVYGPKLHRSGAPIACQYCHTSYVSETGHVQGAIPVPVDQNPGSACSKCHPVMPLWTGKARLDCTTCHPTLAGQSASTLPAAFNSLSAPKKLSFGASGHGQAGSNYDASRNCASCHDQNSPHISSALGTYKRITTNNNSLCFGCHNDHSIPLKVPTVAKQDVPTHATVKGVYNMDCKVCHDVHGAGNKQMVKSFITFGSLTSTITYGSSNDLVSLTPPYRGVCQTCHTNTTHYKRNVDEAGNHPTTGCLNCHSHKDTYAFKPKPCDWCHGYPPAPPKSISLGLVATHNNYTAAKLENYSGGGGAHVKAGHVLPTVKPDQGFSPCVVCHYDGGNAHVGRTAVFHPMTSPTTLQKKANTSVRVNSAYKFNADQPLDASQYRKATPANTGSCWNASCHFQPSPRWSLPPDQTDK